MLRVIACAVAALAACGKGEPRWAKRADQVDLAAWAAVCGKDHGPFDNKTADVPYQEEQFRRPSPIERLPRLPLVECAFSRHLGNQRIFRADIKVLGRPTEVSPELRQAMVALLEDVLPTSVHDVLHEVAASPTVVKKTSHGFRFEGGITPGAAPGDVWWIVRVSSLQ